MSESESPGGRSEVARREHPYTFVATPEAGAQRIHERDVSHDSDSSNRHAWRVSLRLTLVTPVHVGSASVLMPEDVGLPSGPLMRGTVRSDGEAVVPASALRGAVRANYEAITRSCMRVLLPGRRQRGLNFDSRDRSSNQIPRSLVSAARLSGQRGIATARLDTSEVALLDPCPEIRSQTRRPGSPRLCPACSLFGSPGWRGRLRFSDARVASGSAPLSAAVLTTPIPREPRLHKSGARLRSYGQRRGDGPRGSGGRGRESVPELEIAIGKLHGRRFALTSDQVGVGSAAAGQRSGNKADAYCVERVDAMEAGGVLEAAAWLENATLAELGGFFVAFGIGSDVEVRVGGRKAHGLGRVKVEVVGVSAGPDPRSLKTASGSDQAPEQLMNRAVKSWARWRQAWPEGLEELSKVAAARRPASW